MPTSPDINVLTRGALVLETKDSFVSSVTNLNEKKTFFVNSDVPNRIQLVEASYCKYCSLIFYDFI